MKHLISLIVMLLTFVFGVGIDRLLWKVFESKASVEDVVNPVPLPIVETIALRAPVDPYLTAAPPRPPTIFNYGSMKYDGDGAYFWLGSKPKNFAEVNMFELLSTGNLEDQQAGYMAWISTNDNDDYDNHPASFGVITDKRLFITFSQTPKSDFEYRFEGEFVRKDFEAVDGQNKAVIRGTLTKYKGGKKVAESAVSFRFEYLGC